MNADDALKILAKVADLDMTGDVSWRCDGEYAPITFWVNCNDLFFWGSSDCETLTIENLPILEQAFADCKAVDLEWAADMLFCARVRKERPQGAAYPKDPKTWPLFDACGPEREVGFGNPYKPGDYHPETWGKPKLLTPDT